MGSHSSVCCSVAESHITAEVAGINQGLSSKMEQSTLVVFKMKGHYMELQERITNMKITWSLPLDKSTSKL